MSSRRRALSDTEAATLPSRLALVLSAGVARAAPTAGSTRELSDRFDDRPLAKIVEECGVHEWEFAIVEAMVWNKMLRDWSVRAGGYVLDMNNLLYIAAGWETLDDFQYARNRYANKFEAKAMVYRRRILNASPRTRPSLTYLQEQLLNDEGAYRRAVRCVFFAHYPRTIAEANAAWAPIAADLKARDDADTKQRAEELWRVNEAKARRDEEARAAGAKYWWSM